MKINKITKTILFSALAVLLSVSPVKSIVAAEPGVASGNELNLTAIEKEAKNTEEDLFDNSMLGKVRSPEAVYFSVSAETAGNKEQISTFNFSNHTKGSVYIYLKSRDRFSNIRVPYADGKNYANHTQKDMPKIYRDNNKAHFLSVKLDNKEYQEKFWGVTILAREEKSEHEFDLYLEFDKDYPPSVKTASELEEYLSKNAKKYTMKLKHDGSRFHTFIEKEKANIQQDDKGEENMKITKVAEDKPVVDKNIILYAIAGVAVLTGLVTGLVIRNKKRK